MAIFYHKNTNPSITLIGGYDEFVNGRRNRHEPVKVYFKNHIFDTQSEQARQLPLTEDEIIAKLRKNKNYGIDYWEKDRDPVRLNDLLNEGVRGLDDLLEEVDDPVMLKRAIEIDERSSAVAKYKKKLKEILGEYEEVANEEEGN